MAQSRPKTIIILRLFAQIIRFSWAKKVHGFGAGNLVLPGGKSRYYIDTAGLFLLPFSQEAAREVSEETSLPISTKDLVQRGILHVSDEQDTRTVRLYETRLPSATAVHSTELTDLAWYSTEALPYEKMPDDYALWLPSILAGYAIDGFIETNSERILEATIFRQQLNPLGRLEQLPTTIGQ